VRLLLDTHALLWFIVDDAKLSPKARAAIADPRNERLLSPICLLEIALKARLGKLSLSRLFGAMFPTQLTLNRIALLPIEVSHLEPLTLMPMIHRDPFDRLLASTAVVEGVVLVSADATFDSYGVNRLW